jgi:N-hydroxyarylamine O-acetyltransferase
VQDEQRERGHGKLPRMLDDATRERLLRRIGLAAPPPADAAGLRVVHRAFVSRVPDEDLAIQLGEAEPPHPGQLVERVLHGGRGGCCFEANTVLQTLLEALGFAVERREGIVGTRGAFAYMIKRDGDGWWVGRREVVSSPGFRFADAPASLDDFQRHHERLST